MELRRRRCRRQKKAARNFRSRAVLGPRLRPARERQCGKAGVFRSSTPHQSASRTACLAAARSRRGSDMPPACHSLPRRRFATLKGKPINMEKPAYRLIRGLSIFFTCSAARRGSRRRTFRAGGAFLSCPSGCAGRGRRLSRAGACSAGAPRRTPPSPRRRPRCRA